MAAQLRALMRAALLVVLGAVLVAPSAGSRSSSTRTFYVMAEEVDWNYAPAGTNLCSGEPFGDEENVFVASGPRRVGSVYRKALFRRYTDTTFRTPMHHPEHLGTLGPYLHAEAGDEIVVILQNRAAFPVNFEADNVRPRARNPAALAPGKTATYRFYTTDDSAPSSAAYTSSMMHFYRSTVGGPAHISAGLFGPLIITRPGEAAPDGRPVHVDREFVTVLWVSNENESPYWPLTNARRAGIKVNDTETVDEDLEESNLMHGINGMVYCNLPGLSLHKPPSRTRWYAGAVGNEVDLHTLHWHNLVGLTLGGVHTDSIRLLAQSTETLDFTPSEIGTWLLHCHVNDHISAGMMALFNVTAGPADSSGSQTTNASAARTREYFIQAEDVLWDYAPQGLDVCDARPFEDEENTFVLADRPIQNERGAVVGFGIGSKYIKTRYFQYTDDTFAQRTPRTKLQDHLGVMGPVIRAKVGDEIVVHFRSNSSQPVSLHPHGVTYKKSGEGAPYNDGTTGADKADDKLRSGESHSYRWVVTPRAGPGPGESGETKLWMYHSHQNEIMDTYSGLFGALVIVSSDARAYSKQDLRPNDGTTELILHFSVMNEGLSAHMSHNVRRNANNSRLSSKQLEDLGSNKDFVESNLMHSINGFVYCNGPGFKAQVGGLIRAHMYSLGTEVDLHAPGFGNEVMNLGTGSSRSFGKLIPGSFFSADIRPLHAGMTEIRCSVDDHVRAGMRALFSIEASSGQARIAPNQTAAENEGRVHYVAAEQVEWDYAESGMDKCAREPLSEEAEVFTAPGKCRPGSKYVKSVYREYADADFERLKWTRAYAPKFDGVLGPVLHFEVGDTVRIVFRNKLDFAANMNIAGLELLVPKSRDHAVPPGSEMTFVWRVPSSAGPSRSDLSSVPYVYFSSVDSIRHVHAGLVGVIGVAAAGGLDNRKYHPRDISVVHPLLFNVFRENQSPFIDESIRRYAEGECGPKDLEELSSDEEWIESNAMHSINGYSFCNNPLFEARFGRKVRFYVFGFGSEESMHSPVFRNQIIDREVRRGESASGVQILPYSAEAVDVMMVTRGRNVFECAVADHILAGMKGRYLVR